MMPATNWAIARELRAMSRGESKLFVENHIIASAEVQRTRPRPREFQFYTQAHFNARRAEPGAPIGAQLKIIDDDNEPMLWAGGDRTGN